MFLRNGIKKTDRVACDIGGKSSQKVTVTIYNAKIQALNNEVVATELQLKNLEQGNIKSESTLELTKETFLIACRAKKEFLNANNEKRCKALEKLLSNLVVKDKEMASKAILFKKIVKKAKAKPAFRIGSYRGAPVKKQDAWKFNKRLSAAQLEALEAAEEAREQSLISASKVAVTDLSANGSLATPVVAGGSEFENQNE